MLRKLIPVINKSEVNYARAVRRPILDAINEGSYKPVRQVRTLLKAAKKENEDIGYYYISSLLGAADKKGLPEKVLQISQRTFKRLKPSNRYLDKVLSTGFRYTRKYPETVPALNAFFEKNISDLRLIQYIDDYIDLNLDMAYDLFMNSDSFENMEKIRDIINRLHTSIQQVNTSNNKSTPYLRLLAKRQRIINHLATTIAQIDATESIAQLREININSKIDELQKISTDTPRSQRLTWAFYNYRRRHFWSWKNAMITSAIPSLALAPIYYLAVSSGNLTLTSISKVAAIYFPLLALNAFLGASSSIIGQAIKKGIKNVKPDMINPAKVMAFAQYYMAGTTISASFDFLTITGAKLLSSGSINGTYSVPVLVGLALATRVFRDPFFLMTLEKHSFINKKTLEGKFNLKKHIKDSYKHTLNLMKPTKYIEAIKDNLWLPIYYGAISAISLMYLPAAIIPTVGIICSLPVNIFLAMREKE